MSAPSNKIRRSDRMSAMLRILTDSPNKVFTLNTFCNMFGAAKSSMSEDIDALQQMLKQFGLGELETVSGAAGGVWYRARVPHARSLTYLTELCETLSAGDRVLPGGYLYYSDILADPEIVRRMGETLAGEFYDAEPDFVLTMETKGIPVAFSTAHALGVPLVIARHSSKVYEGSAVNINYLSGTGNSIQTMSLSRRAVKEGQKALIIDDFLKAGGTAMGMVELMREFKVEVVGMGFVMETVKPEKKRVSGQKSLMVMDMTGEDGIYKADIRPAEWLYRD